MKKSRPVRQRLVNKNQQIKLTDLTPSLPRGVADPLEAFKYRVIDAVLDARAKQLDKEIMELLK